MLLESMGDHTPREMTVRMIAAKPSPDRTRLIGQLLPPLHISAPYTIWCQGAEVSFGYQPMIQIVLRRSMNLRFVLRVLTVCALISACSTRGVPTSRVPIPSKPSSDRSPNVLTSGSKALVSIYEPGNTVYTIQLKSTIETVVNDSVSQVDSTRLTAVISTTYSNPSPQLAHAVIMVDSITLFRSSTGSSSTSLPPQSFSFDVNQSTGKSIKLAPLQQSCTPKEVEELFHGDEASPAIPVNSELESWADTSSYNLCRGGISLHVTRMSNYQRVSRGSSVESQILNKILRTTEVLISGAGTQWQQAVEASGHGTAVDTLQIQSLPVRLQTISGNSQLEMVFKSPLRSQRFIQTTETQLTRRSVP